MRLRGTDTKTMEEEGLETDGAVSSKSKLRSKVQALSGVDILTDAGAYKSPYQILSEIANVWKDINDMDQAALLELLAGKRAGSVMSAILENPETLKDAFESASDATGSALKENEKYLDSIQGRIDLFNNAVQTLWSNLLDSSVVKNIVDIGAKLVKFLDTWYGKALAVIVGLDSATTKFGKSLLTKLWSWLDISGYSDQIHKEVISAFTVMSKDAITSLSSFDGSALMNFLGGKIEANGINDITKALGAEIMAQKEVTKEVATQILLKQGVKQEDIEGALAAMGYAGANTTLAFSWEAVGVAIKKAGLAFLASPFGKISLIIGGIMLVVHLVDVFTKSTKELAEELDDLRSELESTQSEIESLNSKLKTTRDKIAELEAMPSLSLTDQDELKRLKQQNVELEKQLKIQEALAKSTEEKIANRSEEYIGKAWNSNDIDKPYTIDSNGVISEDRWYTKGTNTTDALNTAISKYKQQQQTVDDYKKLIENWDSNKKVQDNFGKFFSYSELRDIDVAKNGLDIAEKRLQNISDGINLVFADENFTNLEYGMSDEIDGFLDELYAYQLKWQAAQGLYVKSDAISSIFDSTSTEEIQNLGKQLREIADNDTLTDEQKNKQIQDRINNIDKTNEAYGRLKTTMETVGVTAEDIADYFVLETGAFDSSTIEGITAQYAKAAEVINKFKDGSSVIGVDADRNEISMNFDDLFTFDDATKEWQADAEKVSQILKDADEKTREQFSQYITHIKNAQQEAEDAGKNFDITAAFTQASKNIEIDGLLRVIDLTKESLSSVNKTTFKDIADEIDGLIDTFSEFGKALENTASAMDTLYKAQEQMNSSGRISVKTALELMQSTEDWNSVLKINGDTITLQDNAEQALIQSRLNLIEQNINTALSEAELQYAKLEGADATLLQGSADLATVEAQKEFDKAMNQSTAVSAGLGAAAGNLIEKLKALSTLDFNSDAWNTSITGAFRSAYDSALTVLDKQSNPESAEEVAKRIADLRAQKDMIGQLKKNPDSFKNYYDYDETPGDKYKDDGTSDALEKLQKKYEHQLSNLENQKTYVQNEIDRLEAEDKGVSKSYYEKQIAIEQQKMNVYKQERAALTNLLNSTKKGTDEWLKYLARCSRNITMYPFELLGNP